MKTNISGSRIVSSAADPYVIEIKRNGKYSINGSKARTDANILDKRTRGEKVLYSVVFVIMMLQCISLILPILWLFVSSFKEAYEYVLGNRFAFPAKWEFDNYLLAFTQLNLGKATFGTMIFNSVWYTFLATALSAFMPVIPGYILSRYAFKGRNFIYNAVVVIMMIPIVGTGAAYMLLIGAMGIFDTPLYVVVANMGAFSGSFIVYYGFFKSVSWSYAEAAMIDGAGPYMTFFRIMLPHAIPMILTFFLQGLIGNWNNYETTFLYLPSYPTLASGLFSFKAIANHLIDYPVYYAGLIISMVPSLVLFACFSSRIMGTINMGGLKG